MRVGDLSTGITKLREAKEMLERSWEITKEQWADDTRRNFEENHLQPLMERTSAALAATSKLSGILNTAKRDCEPK